MAEPQRGWMGGIKSVLTNVPLTSPDSNVSVHPQARLDARVVRVEAARQTATQLHMRMQQEEMRFQTTIADMTQAFKEQSRELEEHYHKQVDSVQAQYKAAMDDITTKYRDAYFALRREQQAFSEQAKHIDFAGQFVDHFPAPADTEPEPRKDARPVS